MKFDVFISEEPSDYSKMGSVCYLSRMNTAKSLKLYKNIKNKNGKIYINGLKAGKAYYVNGIYYSNDNIKPVWHIKYDKNNNVLVIIKVIFYHNSNNHFHFLLLYQFPE